MRGAHAQFFILARDVTSASPGQATICRLTSDSIASMQLRHSFSPPDNVRLAHLCGPLDEHLRTIEVAFSVTLHRRGEHGVEGPARHRGLEVGDEGVLVDRLSAEEALHQRLVLGLGDAAGGDAKITITETATGNEFRTQTMPSAPSAASRRKVSSKAPTEGAAVSGSTTPQSSVTSISNGGAGIAALNLRNLGRERTLVELGDGQVGDDGTTDPVVGLGDAGGLRHRPGLLAQGRTSRPTGRA